jgi:hypothetical protein
MTPIIKYLPVKSESEKRKAEMLTLVLEGAAVLVAVGVWFVCYILI